MASSDTPARDSAYARATKYRSPTICLTTRTHVGTRRASTAPSGGLLARLPSGPCAANEMRQEDDGGQREENEDGGRDLSRQSDDAARGVGDAGGRAGHPDDGGEAEQKARGETGPGE